MAEETQSEIEQLRQQAKDLNIKHHPKLGVKKLSILVAEANGIPVPQSVVAEPAAAPAPAAAVEPVKPKKKATVSAAEINKARRLQNIREAKQLVRIRLTCMDPNKKEWDGEIITVQNKKVGTLRKYIPFNNENGYHVPKMILNVLKTKQCQVFHTVVRNGVKVRQGKLVPAYAIQELPPITKDELKAIATRQAAQGEMEDS